METYKGMIIEDTQKNIIAILNDISVEITVDPNKNSTPVFGGRYNKLIDLVNGKFEVSITLFGVVGKIQSDIENKKVNIHLMEDDTGVSMYDVLPKYKGNNLVVISKEICRVREKKIIQN